MILQKKNFAQKRKIFIFGPNLIKKFVFVLLFTNNIHMQNLVILSFVVFE